MHSRRGGMKVTVAQSLNPAREEGEDIGLLAQGDPQDTIGKASLHGGVMGQRCDERGLADATQPVDGADDQCACWRVGGQILH